MAKNDQVGVENTSKGECKEEKKSGKMKELLGKITRPLVEGIAVAASVAVLSMPSCALDLDGKGKFRIDADAQEEQVEDPAVENEDMEDVVDGTPDIEEVTEVLEEDVGVEDVSTEEAEDVTAEDVVEEEAPADVVEEDAEEEEIAIVCEPVAMTSTVSITTGSSSTVGNITVEYVGVDTSGDGIYRILCDGSVVDTLNIAEGGDGSVALPGGGSIQIHVNTVRSWGSNITVTVLAP